MCLKTPLEKSSGKVDGIFSRSERKKIVLLSEECEGKQSSVPFFKLSYITIWWPLVRSLNLCFFIRRILPNAAEILDILQCCYFKIHETHIPDNITLMPKNGLFSTSSYLHKWQNLFWLPRMYLLYLATIVLGNCDFKTIQPSPLFFDTK